MKKVHGMGARERLLLQIAVQLHDCGKYISMADVAECSYRIIMATEIIGLSTEERQVIASAVRYNTTEFVYYENFDDGPDLTGKDIFWLRSLRRSFVWLMPWTGAIIRRYRDSGLC